MKALKGRMPRFLPDHRSREAKLLREVYLDLIETYPVRDGIGRRLALLCAQTWRTYERLSVEIVQVERRNGRGRGTAQTLRRLRRQQNIAAKQFRFGVANLKQQHTTERPPPTTLSPDELLNEVLRHGNS